MTPKQKVLRKFPSAVSYPWKGKTYVIQSKASGIVIGAGKTARDAWRWAFMRYCRTAGSPNE